MPIKFLVLGGGGILGFLGRRGGSADFIFMGARSFLTLGKDVFLPSKNLLSAFYKTLPSKNPSKNLVFTENPYRRLLRTLL